MLPKKLAFVDIETSGARAQYDRIIEIGILRVEDNKLVDTYSTLINPESFVSPFIENLTGISKFDLETAPSFSEVKDKIQEILTDCVFVAHNVRFDYGFMKNEFKRFGIAFSPKHFCTVKLSRTLFPEYPRHNLDSIIERFNFSCERRHRAFDDAKILWDFYTLLQKDIPADRLLDAVNRALKKPSIPIHVPQEEIENLPETPGVYVFYAHNTIESEKDSNSLVPLYIGKSINIRERVLSHFAADHASSIEMNIAQQIEHIETIETSGELGALFREATMIKEMQPLYNRRLRLKRKLVILRQIQDKDGYDTVTIDTVNIIEPHEIAQILGIFRSRRQAKEFLIETAKRYSLCQKILGIEKTHGACFASHLGWCHGACVAKELPLHYNVRFTNALYKYKLKTWPYRGPILIEEKDELRDIAEGFLVDKWCFLGSTTSHGDSQNDKTISEYIFDLGTYKILVNFIFNPSNKYKIKTIPSMDQDVSHFSSIDLFS